MKVNDGNGVNVAKSALDACLSESSKDYYFNGIAMN